MRKSRLATIAFAAIALLSLNKAPVKAQQDTPKAAKAIIVAAQVNAKKSHRAIMILFTESTCKWCKKFDLMMARPEFKKMFDANYVVVHLDVLEGGEGVRLYENPGGRDYLKSMGGEGSGVPFYAWTDAAGKMTANSNVSPGHANLGYPALPAQIELFMGIIKKTAPRWSAVDQKKLHDYMIANPPKF